MKILSININASVLVFLTPILGYVFSMSYQLGQFKLYDIDFDFLQVDATLILITSIVAAVVVTVVFAPLIYGKIVSMAVENFISTISLLSPSISILLRKNIKPNYNHSPFIELATDSLIFLIAYLCFRITGNIAFSIGIAFAALVFLIESQTALKILMHRHTLNLSKTNALKVRDLMLTSLLIITTTASCYGVGYFREYANLSNNYTVTNIDGEERLVAIKSGSTIYLKAINPNTQKLMPGFEIRDANNRIYSTKQINLFDKTTHIK